MFEGIKKIFVPNKINLGNKLSDQDMPILTQSDGWRNILTGIGDPRQDKSMSAQAFWAPMSFEEASIIYSSDPLAKKIATMILDASLYHDFRFSLSDVEEKENQEWNKKRIKVLEPLFNLRKLIYEAALWGRIYGAGYILFGVEDGARQQDPLDLKRIKKIKYIQYFGPQELFPVIPGYNPESKNYLQPDYYTLATFGGGSDVNTGDMIHSSRVVRFDGEELLRLLFIQNRYTHDSVFNSIKTILADYHQAVKALGHVLNDWSVGYIKIQGLRQMIASGREKEIIGRLSLVERTKSIIRTIFIGEGEEYGRISGQFSGIEGIIDTLRQELATQVKIPHTLLFNEGVNAGASGISGSKGENEQSDWQAFVSEYQKHKLKPQIKRIYEIILSAQDNPLTKGNLPEFDILFTAARSLNMEKEADAYDAFSSADDAYLRMGTLTPQEIRNSRFGPNGTFSNFQTKIEISDTNSTENQELENKQKEPNEKENQNPSESGNSGYSEKETSGNQKVFTPQNKDKNNEK